MLLAIPPGLIAGEKQSAVVVVGAGLSGLNAALLLEEQGYRVTVLEASNRIGGRLHTLDDVPGTPEAGGNVIGPSYARIIDRAREFDVSLEPAPQIAGGRRAMNYFIGGQFIAPGEWASSPQNPFPERLRHMPPGSALFGVLRPNPLQTPADWRGEDVAQYDVPVLGLLEKLGFDQRGRALAGQANSYGNSLDDTSLLAMYRMATVYALGGEVPGQPMAVEGGNQRLPEAMARAVRGDVLTGKWVTAINHSDSGVTVKTRDGSAYRADYALVTVPLPALRNITIEPALPALQQRAIYPAAKGTVKLAAVRDWNSDPLAGGSWLRWQPGQITAFATALARPVGRLFFAGEHTAITNTGMEGAMESAERAVGEILAMSQPAAGSVASGEQLFLHCQGCHSVAQGETHKLGPNLYGFFAQPRATREGYAYSDALKTAGGAWDRGSLREWLLDPQAAVSGNRMIYTNPYSEEDLESLLGYLETLSQ